MSSTVETHNEDEEATCRELLEFDMWEGQFEFIGQQYANNNNNNEDLLVAKKKELLVNGKDEDLNLVVVPVLKNGENGRVKPAPSHTQAWCRHLNHHVQMLQQQMNVLADNQNHTDERYTRAKQENATLQARVHMLEEQLREVELRSEEKLVEEERRHRELVARVDREKQLQVENCAIRLQTLELENSSLKDEATRCRTQSEKLRTEKQKLEEQMRENDGTIYLLKEEILSLREQERKYKENTIANQQLIEELSLEVERLRNEQHQALAELSSRSIGISETAHEELQEQFTSLRDENRRLQEAHDEMQALLLTRSVEEGRSLLTGNKSLAAELEAMSQDELGEVTREELKVRTALKEQQEVNAQLRAYIDGILLNIVENYPQLLEVKANP